MGLLKHLLFWPVTGPLFLTEFSLGKVEGVVREELTDDTRIKAELMELQLKLELGDIDDEEYVRREAELMQQLREIRDWREQFGMGVSGGPVRVQRVPEQAGDRAGGATEVAGDEVAGDVTGEDVAGEDVAGEDVADTASENRPRVAGADSEVTIELNFDED